MQLLHGRQEQYQQVGKEEEGEQKEQQIIYTNTGSKIERTQVLTIHVRRL